MKDIDKIKDINIYPSILGKAGELRVASELLLRGFDVSLMLVDAGADLILSNGVRIQVKSGRLRKSIHYTKYKHKSKNKIIKYPSKNIKYVFCFKGWKRDKSGKRKQEIHKLDLIDFVILWAIDDDIFFIIPANEIRGKLAVNLYPKNQDHYLNKFKNKWNLLKK